MYNIYIRIFIIRSAPMDALNQIISPSCTTYRSVHCMPRSSYFGWYRKVVQPDLSADSSTSPGLAQHYSHDFPVAAPASGRRSRMEFWWTFQILGRHWVEDMRPIPAPGVVGSYANAVSGAECRRAAQLVDACIRADYRHAPAVCGRVTENAYRPCIQ
jgi:hypothetical protein